MRRMNYLWKRQAIRFQQLDSAALPVRLGCFGITIELVRQRKRRQFISVRSELARNLPRFGPRFVTRAPIPIRSSLRLNPSTYL